MTGRHRANRTRKLQHIRFIDGKQVRMVLRCSWLAKGFCAASVDGYCIGGYRPGGVLTDPKCHG